MAVMLSLGTVNAEYSETLFKEFKPDGFMTEVTYKDVTYSVGTLPTYSNGYFAGNAVNPGVMIRMMGTGVAAYENGTDGNVVFKLGGGSDYALNGASGMGTHPTYRQSLRVKFPSSMPTAACLLCTDISGGGFYIQDAKTKSGIFFRNGGAYVYDYDKSTNKTFIDDGTIEGEKWYRVESYTDFQGSEYQMQNAKVYDDETGELIAESGWTRVSELSPQGGFQCYARNSTAPEILVDDWEVYKCEGIERANFDIVTDDETRQVYKIECDMTLDGNMFTNETVTLKADNAALNLTGKYSVEYADNAIVVTTDEPLPYNENYTITINCLPSTAEGMLAVDVSDTSGLVKTFSTGEDVFKTENATFGEDKCVSAQLSNPSGTEREYMMIVSSIDGTGKYLETQCVYGTLAPHTASQDVKAPAITAVSGGKVKLMVWDNWKDMNSLSETFEFDVN